MIQGRRSTCLPLSLAFGFCTSSFEMKSLASVLTAAHAWLGVGVSGQGSGSGSGSRFGMELGCEFVAGSRLGPPLTRCL